MNTPTPRTDTQEALDLPHFQSLYPHKYKKAVRADFARQLEQELSEASRHCGELERQVATAQYDCLKKCVAERDQLRKVADELAKHFYQTKTGNNEAHQAHEAYNNLPHVQQRKSK